MKASSLNLDNFQPTEHVSQTEVWRQTAAMAKAFATAEDLPSSQPA